ncbi:hypothetical protein CTEN210_18263 [Chaetoceros tenuissimus]|uniref:ETS domain-containing protein n=1 Tax=Chaetoceros tenuissimus TaxID=426638 RepID=A0AAD3HFA5_9STRA|nr:hypothetical protein CTEN210_18263 [Chaetoceros tenuissimus]
MPTPNYMHIAPNGPLPRHTNAIKEASSKKFPQQLMEILSDAGISDVITWLPHGKSFKILEPDDLVERVKYPGVCKYSSFTRKLNLWGFRQVRKGQDAGAFFHPLFIRDEPHLCHQIVNQRRTQREKARRRQDDANAPVYSSSTAVQNSQTKYTHPRIVTPTFTDHMNNRTAMVSNFSSPTPITASVTNNPNIGGYMYIPGSCRPPSHVTMKE